MYCSNWVREGGLGRPWPVGVTGSGAEGGDSSSWGPSALVEAKDSWPCGVKRGLWRATACSGLG